jgi:signal peptidase I
MPFASEITKEEAEPGDIIVFRYGRCYAHGAIISQVKPEITIIHAYSIARRVIEEPLNANHALTDPKRKPRYFSHWKKA